MFYTHGALDRADHLRKDSKALAELRLKSSTRLVAIWQGTALVSYAAGKGQPQIATLPASYKLKNEEPIFLGLDKNIAYFAVDTDELSDAQREQLGRAATTINGEPLAAEFADLRIIGPTLPANDGALLAYARGLVYWQRNTRFCHRCGHALESQMGGHMRHCTNDSCGYNTFPRTDPAVIMLVTHVAKNGDETCLFRRLLGLWSRENHSSKLCNARFMKNPQSKQMMFVTSLHNHGHSLDLSCWAFMQMPRATPST